MGIPTFLMNRVLIVAVFVVFTMRNYNIIFMKNCKRKIKKNIKNISPTIVGVWVDVSDPRLEFSF